MRKKLTRKVWSRRSLISAVREAVHTGYAEYQLVKRFPVKAKRSSVGVRVEGCPVKPRSPYPRSGSKQNCLITFIARAIIAIRDVGRLKTYRLRKKGQYSVYRADRERSPAQGTATNNRVPPFPQNKKRREQHKKLFKNLLGR